MALKNPLQVARAPRQGRVNRNPIHRWNVRAQPWQIQPICIAPVIPGETLKSAVWQGRTVTDPVKNRLMGWWHEYYWYYVPFRALAIRDELEQMVVDPEWTPANIDSNVAVANHYFYGRNSIDFVEHCLNAVVAHDFRKPDYALSHTIGGLPITSINVESWANSALTESLVTAFDVDVDLNSDDTITASEVNLAMQQYEMLKSNGLIEMSYQDYLKTYGIRGEAVKEPDKQYTPELLRYSRDWTYPSNTPDATGAVSTVLSWSTAERIDKDRFFQEPGFIFGVMVSRPKVYLGRQVGAAVSMLDTIRSWLPKVMTDDPTTSLKAFAAASDGPITAGFDPDGGGAAPVEGYVIDVRDLFLYGDQFVNNAAALSVPLPATNGNLSFASETDYDTIFVEQTGTKQHIETDGLIALTIAGSQRDYTAKNDSAITIAG